MPRASYKDAFSGYEGLCEYCVMAFAHQDRILNLLPELKSGGLMIPYPCKKTHMINFRIFLTNSLNFHKTGIQPCIMLDEDYNTFYAFRTDIDLDGARKFVSIYETTCSAEYMRDDLTCKIHYLQWGMKRCLEDIWNKLTSYDDMNKIANDSCNFVNVTPS